QEDEPSRHMRVALLKIEEGCVSCSLAALPAAASTLPIPLPANRAARAANQATVSVAPSLRRSQSSPENARCWQSKPRRAESLLPRTRAVPASAAAESGSNDEPSPFLCSARRQARQLPSPELQEQSPLLSHPHPASATGSLRNSPDRRAHGRPLLQIRA